MQPPLPLRSPIGVKYAALESQTQASAVPLSSEARTERSILEEVSMTETEMATILENAI